MVQARFARLFRHDLVQPAGESGPEVGREMALDLFRAARAQERVHGVVLSAASGVASDLALMLPALLAGQR